MNISDWTYTEKVCYISHIWADKEKEYSQLEDFDYTDMAKAASQFIDCQPNNVEFTIHIENCFDVLVNECKECDIP